MRALLVTTAFVIAIVLPLDTDAAQPSCSWAEDRRHAHNIACQNYAQTVDKKISNQIVEELKASYTYMAMGAYFSRDDQAYRGFAKFFNKASDEEWEHAQMLINYSLERGGRPKIETIQAPDNEFDSPRDAIGQALALERLVNGKLLELHDLAASKNDPHLQDFLESNFLTEQVEAIKQLADWYTILTRLNGDNLGIHIFDEELFHGQRQ